MTKSEQATARMLGDNLFKIRIAQKHSLTDMVKRTGMNKSVIWNAENGQNLTIRVLYKLCRALSVQPHEVLPPL